MRRRGRIGAAAVLLALGACTGAAEPGPVSSQPDPRHRVAPGLHVGVPVADAAEHRTVRLLVDSIDATPSGEVIRIVGFSFTLTEVADALVRAADRGVHVKVVLDDHSRGFGTAAALAGALGEDRRADSFVVMADDSARGRGGGTHQKSWSFSRTGRSHHVVLVGSMNLTRFSTGQYTDMYAFVDRRDVWRAFGQVFRHQVRDRPMASPAFVHRLGRHTAYFHPGFDEDEDPVLRLLDALPAAGTRMRISHYAWHHPRGYRIAHAVAGLARGGAVVDFIEGPYVDDDITALLRDAGVRVHQGEVPKLVHTKLLLADHPSTGGRRRLVLTGSDNFEDLSLRNDDVDLLLEASPRDYGDYVRFFDRILRDAR